MNKFFAEEDFFDEEGKVRITPNGERNLLSLAQIVMNKHYSYALSSDRADLQQVALLKALELLHGGMYDGKRASLRNYIYTGMMNEMRNYLYRTSRDIKVDDEYLISLNEDKSCSIENYMEDPKILDKEILKLASRFITDEQVFKDVKAYLAGMGFEVNFTGKPYFKKEVEKIVCLVIWGKMKS